MPAAQPKSIGTELIKEMGEHLLRIDRYMEASDELHLKWDAQIDKLVYSQPIEAQFSLAMLAQFCGDVVNFEHFMDRAVEKGAPLVQVAGNLLMVYSNLVYATKAQAAAKQAVSIALQNIGLALNSVVASGAISFARGLLQQAERAKLNFDNVDQISAIREIASESVHWRATDADIGSAIDCAGEVIRRYKLFWLEAKPRLAFDPGTACMSIRYKIATSSKQAAAMNLEVTDLIIERNLQEVPVTLGFIGVAN